MNLDITRALVRKFLEKATLLPLEEFTVQGFGMLRYRLTPDMRLHVWDSSLRLPGVSDLHDHTQWAFNSYVVSGQIVNIRYWPADGTTRTDTLKVEGAVIQTGIGGGFKEAIPATELYADSPELYLPGQGYHQEPAVLHRTLPADGTVTIIEQQRVPDCESARVFWPVGGRWVDAEPRKATWDEVMRVTARALEIFG